MLPQVLRGKNFRPNFQVLAVFLQRLTYDGTKKAKPQFLTPFSCLLIAKAKIGPVSNFRRGKFTAMHNCHCRQVKF